MNPIDEICDQVGKMRTFMNKDPEQALAAMLAKENLDPESRRKTEEALSTMKNPGPMELDVKNDIFGDGEQSMVYGKAKNRLQVHWASGFDYNPVSNPKLSAWCRVCAFADINAMAHFMSEAKAAGKLTELLERRESGLRFCAIFMIICGARNRGDKNPGKFVEAAKMVIEAGCRVNAKDVAGYTPLHHCFTKYGNATSFKIARLLVENGADVNAQNRLGLTALFEPVMNNMLEAAEFLLESGIDPKIKDNDGIACIKLALWNQPMSNLFSKSYIKMAQNDKGSAVPSCEACGEDRGRLRNCAACLQVKYCSAKCQRKHWPEHQKVCGGLNEEKTVSVKPEIDEPGPGQVLVMRNHVKGDWKSKDKLGKFEGVGKLMKIKIQISLSPPGGPMLVYNKSRKYHVMIPSKDPNHGKIHDAVVEMGYAGIKAYFLCKPLKTGELLVDLSKAYPETF